MRFRMRGYHLSKLCGSLDRLGQGNNNNFSLINGLNVNPPQLILSSSEEKWPASQPALQPRPFPASVFGPMKEQLGLHQPFWVRFLSCFCKHVHLSLCYLFWGMMIGCKVACDGKERESETVDEGEGRWEDGSMKMGRRWM